MRAGKYYALLFHSQDFENIATECRDAVRGAFHQLKELAKCQGNSLVAVVGCNLMFSAKQSDYTVLLM